MQVTFTTLGNTLNISEYAQATSKIALQLFSVTCLLLWERHKTLPQIDHVACGYATLDSLMIQALLHSPSVRHAKSQLRGRLPFCLVTFTETPAAE